ncbi:unnamed protein product [Cylindrotheca closterium]|uniref:Inositol-pentakisphosphate 2-kinase n=1 Tax=Cylindrotheca closterium TaxID=2856 RepID=A0AAD2CSY4_9STRA|nr:unnamed protein product [Cylindrotheca closterium]
MDPSKWQYLVEGGENAIYEQTTTTSSGGSFHQLLRIRKQDLALSDQMVSCFSKTKACHDKAENSKSYLEGVVAPLLEPYIDVPATIHLEWSFVAALKQQTMEHGCIPDARKSSWNLPPKINGDSLGSDNMERQVRAQLIPDYRMLPVTPTKDDDTHLIPATAVLSVELKPKAGYLACSPLVQPKHRIKYQHSRYVLKQKLYQLEQQEVIRSGWSSADGQVQQSHFDPLNLYSGDPERIQKAIQELFRCPQNNLRVTCNKQLFLSKEKDGSPAYSENAEMLSQDILSEWIGGVGSSSLDVLSTMMINISNWLVGVFQQETVLQRLQKLQKLDIVDADGAILLYHRLVELCKGSHEEAQSLLDNVMTMLRKETDGTPPLEDSPFAWSQTNDSDDFLPNFCRKIKEFEKSLLEVAPKLPPEKFLDHHHEEMMKMIQSMDSSDCQYLLWNWLLSLTLNDISIFVTFQKVKVPFEKNFQELDSSPITTGSRSHGILKLPRENKEDDVHLAYTIRIIDCDGKASNKLRKRWKKEEPFALLL